MPDTLIQDVGSKQFEQDLKDHNEKAIKLWADAQWIETSKKGETEAARFLTWETQMQDALGYTI